MGEHGADAAFGAEIKALSWGASDKRCETVKRCEWRNSCGQRDYGRGLAWFGSTGSDESRFVFSFISACKLVTLLSTECDEEEAQRSSNRRRAEFNPYLYLLSLYKKPSGYDGYNSV